MSPKITDRNKPKKENIYDGHWHSSPQFCIQAFFITRYHSGGQSSEVLERGVVGGRAALLIRLEANSLLHIHQAELLQRQVCCWSAPVTLEGRVYVQAWFSLRNKEPLPSSFVFCLKCSSNSLRREITSLNERRRDSKHWKSHPMSHLCSFRHFSVPQFFFVQDSMY